MTMTVKSLREALVGLPDEMPVICQKDSEGNGYSPLAGADSDNTSYVAYSKWSGVVRLTKLTKAAEAKGFSDEDVAENGVPCLVLYPTN